jgi:hypothetical protein
MDTFLFISLIIFVAALAASAAVFGYHLLLKGTISAKAARLSAAEARIDGTSVQDFIRTRNRFASAEMLLGSHVASSQLFTALESRTLQNVRFSELSLEVADDRSATLSMTGTARTFNALAAQSAEFAKEEGLTRVIFSDIALNENATVSFALTAEVRSSLIVMGEPDIVPALPAEPELPAEEPVGTEEEPAASEAAVPATTAPASSSEADAPPVPEPVAPPVP